MNLLISPINVKAQKIYLYIYTLVSDLVWIQLILIQCGGECIALNVKCILIEFAVLCTSDSFLIDIWKQFF